MPIINIIILSFSFWLFFYLLSWSINHGMNKNMVSGVFDGGSTPFGHNTFKFVFKNFDSFVVIFFVFIIGLFTFPWVIIYNQTNDFRYGILILILIIISFLIFGLFYKIKKVNDVGKHDR